MDNDPLGFLDDLRTWRRDGMTPAERKREDRMELIHEAWLTASIMGGVLAVFAPWAVGAFVIIRSIFLR